MFDLRVGHEMGPCFCTNLPSGNSYPSYGKSPFIVDLPIENGDFP
jgi:hypothetical protein